MMGDTTANLPYPALERQSLGAGHDLLELRFLDELRFRDELRFLGTFAPFFRASESPIAIACFRLFTLPP
jgi:hypothetical protein